MQVRPRWRSCKSYGRTGMRELPAKPARPVLQTACLRWGKEHRGSRSEEHTSELQSQFHLVCHLLLEKKNRLHADQVRQGIHFLLRGPERPDHQARLSAT